MADKTGIQWTNATWNPVTGCTKVSPGCANCYIEKTPPFRMKGVRFERGRIPVTLHPDRLDQPLHWRKPRRVFVCSMGDLFHEDVPDEFIEEVFATMALADRHTFQVLTKRPERMKEWMGGYRWTQIEGRAQNRYEKRHGVDPSMWLSVHLPLPNVWLGVSAENQEAADQRIPILLATPAAKRFVSCEPLLGPLDLGAAKGLPIYREAEEVTQFTSGTADYIPYKRPGRGWQRHDGMGPFLDWVIVGGESGGSPERALVERCWCRFGPMAPHLRPPCESCNETTWRPKPEALEWLRSIRNQCQAAGVSLFLKQLGGPTPKAGGRLLDGRTWDEFPEREAVPA